MGAPAALRGWALALGACALLAVAGAEVAGLRALHYAFKPLATLLVLAMALRLPTVEAPAYRRWIVAGLALSLLGDVFLMLPFDGFVFGLGSFLLAHLAYLVALRRRGGWFAIRWPLAAYAAIAALVLLRLWPGLPAELRVPVIVYVVALAGMAAQAASVWRQCADAPARLAAVGGAAFVVSDALLALDRFAAPVPHAATWVLATYWSAQWCIARSVARVAPAAAA